MALATQITGAVIGVTAAVAVVFGPEFGPIEPVHIECTDAHVMFAPDDNAMRIDLTCYAGGAPVILTIPDVPPF